jgi:hypothetical protein
MRRGPSGPPTSPPDPGPISTHDHEWRPVEEAPIIEDGAAIFHERCTWAEVTSATTSEKHDETFYGYGAECEETRSYRFEYSHLILGDGTEIELPEITEWEEADEMEAEMVEYIEEAYHNGDADINVCPAREYGEVVISAFNWELHYEA